MALAASWPSRPRSTGILRVGSVDKSIDNRRLLNGVVHSEVYMRVSCPAELSLADFTSLSSHSVNESDSTVYKF